MCLTVSAAVAMFRSDAMVLMSVPAHRTVAAVLTVALTYHCNACHWLCRTSVSVANSFSVSFPYQFGGLLSPSPVYYYHNRHSNDLH